MAYHATSLSVAKRDLKLYELFFQNYITPVTLMAFKISFDVLQMGLKTNLLLT